MVPTGTKNVMNGLGIGERLEQGFGLRQGTVTNSGRPCKHNVCLGDHLLLGPKFTVTSVFSIHCICVCIAHKKRLHSFPY